MRRWFTHVAFRIRWWRWKLSGPGIPIEIYLDHAHRLDHESRMMIWDRREAAWLAQEPKP